MKNLERIRERFLRDPSPRRLGALAADLARLSSLARHPKGGGEATALMMEESQYFIEWVSPEVAAEIATELVDIQIMLALWRRTWPEAQQHVAQRALLSFQAKKWSNQVLRYSGLLDSG